MNRKRISWIRLAHALSGIVVIALFIAVGPPCDSDGAALEASNTALRLLATVLSILAGFLMAVIAILGDPRSLFTGSWRVASAHARQIRRVLNRSVLLFYVYLATIAAAFLSTIIGSYVPDPTYERWGTHLALGLGCAALIWSCGLPTVIRRALVDRLRDEVDERKAATSTSA